MLYNKLGFRKEFSNFYAAEDFFNEEYPVAEGFGGYDPTRKVTLDHTLEVLQKNIDEANKLVLTVAITA